MPTANMPHMKEIQEIQGIQVSGLMVKRAVKMALSDDKDLTKEQVVAAVQIAIKGKRDFNGDEITFSLAGLNRIYQGNLPTNGWEIILTELANVCKCHVSSFAEPEIKTA